jgi:hypothetical protein
MFMNKTSIYSVLMGLFGGTCPQTLRNNEQLLILICFERLVFCPVDLIRGTDKGKHMFTNKKLVFCPTNCEQN